MSEVAEQLKPQLLGLSEKDRTELAYFLLHSLNGAEAEEDVRAAWEAELEKRWARIESGQAKGIPAEQALAEIRGKRT